MVTRATVKKAQRNTQMWSKAYMGMNTVPQGEKRSRTMFRVTFFVDDKKLGESLLGLQGIARGRPEVEPVANAKVGRNGGLIAATSKGTSVDLFLNHVHSLGVTEVTPKMASEFLKSLGRSPANSSTILKSLVRQKIVTKSGKGGRGNKMTYRIIASPTPTGDK